MRCRIPANKRSHKKQNVGESLGPPTFRMKQSIQFKQVVLTRGNRGQIILEKFAVKPEIVSKFLA